MEQKDHPIDSRLRESLYKLQDKDKEIYNAWKEECLEDKREYSKECLDVLQGLLENAIALKGGVLNLIPGINGSFTANIDLTKKFPDMEIKNGSQFSSSLTNAPEINRTISTCNAYLWLISQKS